MFIRSICGKYTGVRARRVLVLNEIPLCELLAREIFIVRRGLCHLARDKRARLMAEVIRLKHVVVEGERLADGVLHLIHIGSAVRTHRTARAVVVEVCMAVIRTRARKEGDLAGSTFRERIHVRISSGCHHRVHVI